ncbi:hypothetical protein VHEMI08892 [[Torrubiella] hemipterigena]|uniref:ABM domain-containing protein n=1 Tax=[Torrubiella] hemipterigena TaxID=1531966 RepID=A0A0A1TPC8_9HYPO|nr:hypothetical protein VHEMI08892 [[Torrubiella] hemipterigena]
MFVVVFESTAPAEVSTIAETYYAKLEPILKTYSGFIQELSFSSPEDPNSGVTIARFENEEAAVRWRNDPTHLRIQKASREKVYSHYRIRAGNVIVPSKAQSPEAKIPERILVLLEQPKTIVTPLKAVDLGADIGHGVTEFVTYASDDVFVHIVGLKSREAASLLADSESIASCSSTSIIEVVREYSKTDRKEVAP